MIISELITSLLSVSLSLIGITFIIVFHEFGHYIFCKLFNVYTPTFSIGMGKKLFSKKIGDTEFCISNTPIGGYVEIATEEGKDGYVGFNQLNYLQKFLITLGGIFFNIILTYIIFTALFLKGMPETAIVPYESNLPTIASIQEKSINESFLQPNDTIININKHEVKDDALEIKQEISAKILLEDNQIPVVIERNGEKLNTTLHINIEKVPMSLGSRLGVTFTKKAPPSFTESLCLAWKTTTFHWNAIIKGLKDMVNARHTKGFVGPLMAIAIGSKSAKKGLGSLLFLLAIISINLAFMNLLPLPIFDGGQIVIFTIETILGKQLSENIRNGIGMSSWILALGLLIIFTARDIYTLFIG